MTNSTDDTTERRTDSDETGTDTPDGETQSHRENDAIVSDDQSHEDFLSQVDETLGTDDTGAVTEDDSEEVPDPGIETTATTDPLGHVTASDGLSVGRGGHNVQVYVDTDTRDDLRVGDYLQIPYPDSMGEENAELFGRISQLSYEQRAEYDDKSDVRRGILGETIDERQYSEISDLSPIGIIEGEDPDAYERVPVDRVPKPFTRVYRPDDEALLQTGLNLAEQGPFVGYLAASGKPVPRDDPLHVRFADGTGDREPAIWQHTLIAGATGAGKTFVTKNILRQYASDVTYTTAVQTEEGESEERDLPLGIVIIDPENEYSGLAGDPADVADETLRDLEDEGIEVGGIDTGRCSSHDIRTYVPMVDGATPPALDDHYEFGIPFEIVQYNTNLVLSNAIPRTSRGALRSCLGDYFEAVDDPTYEDFLEWLDENQDDLADDHNINSQMWAAIWRRIRDDGLRRTFDTGDTMLTDITGEIFRPGRVTVVPTKHLSETEEVVVLAVLSLVGRSKLTDVEDADANISETPLLLCVDEAHEYLGGAESIQKEDVIREFRKIAKRGRKHHLGLHLVSQDPQDIDSEIRNQVRSRVLLEMEPDTVDSIHIPGGFGDELTSFGQGQMVVKAPSMETIEARGLDVCVVRY